MLDIRVSLRVSSEVVSLKELERLLGRASSGHSKGDAFSRGSKKRSQTVWILESSRSPRENMEEHINEILCFIDGKKPEFTYLGSTCSFNLFCMLSSENGQGGAVLSPQILSRVSDYNLELVLDVYSG